MKRVNSTAEKILRCVQNRHHAPQKPAIFPIASLPDMDAFEKIDEDGYSNAVNYFCYIGGFNLREAVNICCLKESLKDTIAPSFIVHGGAVKDIGHYMILVLLWRFMVVKSIIFIYA
ncbi:uncharacterized protein LOC109862297 [Pseudomyrmex gracilis]|uniref:uncharacterized protein LOC109862297 n=1 Tax=Pseudomyrmex gracilis TaxID=219809 RepID=UPI0009954FE2|nr:uncharacterized protein LOC109862297 [Pseudomyrmex gracilis]